MSSGTEEAQESCLEQTRTAVLNVLVIVGAGIALSGWVLGRQDSGAKLWSPVLAQRWAHGALFGLIGISLIVRRVVGSRSALRPPERRAGRFYWAHTLGAAIGALAVPLGFGYGWAIRPRLDAVAPFWIAALALGFLAMPRAQELDGLDDLPPPPSEPSR